MKPLIPFFHRLTKKANKKLELDLRQVAVSTKSRLDAVEGFSGKIVGFVAFIINCCWTAAPTSVA